MTLTLDADRYARWRDAGLADSCIDRADAADILAGRDIDLMSLLAAAGAVRRRHCGDTVSIHVLDNVRNGACPEDCGYCGQSKDSDAPVAPYKLKPVDDIVAEAAAAQQRGAYRFCMALSGRGPSDRDIDHMAQAVQRIKAMGMRTCLSSGLLDDAKAQRLAEAGLDRLNHNLNTSRRHYPDICTTHTYDDRVDTLRAARSAGLGVCSGVIVGMDETHDDLLDVAYALREMKAESIPVNFLLPIEGNRVNHPRSGGRPLDPQFVLRVLCMMRLVNPTAEIRIAAGREVHLRSLQPLSLAPANSLFMDGYLLTEGAGADDTLQMILDAGYKPVFDEPKAVSDQVRRFVDRAGEDEIAAPDHDGAVPEVHAALKVSVKR
ncbi:biotin synthase BioB [Planctomycetales bacterium ZRK34]|nr:biotin synthase BioB [Planctomycetales bacterium ZRK34]